MKREIINDRKELEQKSTPVAFSEAKDIIKDLMDTAKEYPNCVGLAAPQIGILKKVVVVRDRNAWIALVNPVITQKSHQMEEEIEGCLSVDGRSLEKRHSSVTVIFIDQNGKTRKRVFVGFTARIVQHEIDHLFGKLIKGDIKDAKVHEGSKTETTETKEVLDGGGIFKDVLKKEETDN